MINIIQLTNNNFYEEGLKISGDKVAWSSSDGHDQEIFLYDGTATFQLTDNSYDDYGWTISTSEDKVVWSGYDGHDEEIFLYDGNTVVQLTNNDFYDFNPQLAGDKVVWSGYDGYDEEIFLYDGTAVVQLTNNDFYDFNPQLAGDKVVWSGYDGYDEEIFLYDGTAVVQLTNNDYDDYGWTISTSGDNVVWSGYDGHDEEIFLYDGTAVVQLTNNDSYDFNPQLSGDKVVWSGYLNNDEGEVFLYNGATTFQLTNNIFYEEGLKVSGDKVVWSSSDGHDQEIFLNDGNATFQLTDNNYDDYGWNIAISGDNLVWSAYDGHDEEIFLYNGATVIQLTNNDFDDFNPQLSGDKVVWSGYQENYESEIFLATLPSDLSESTPVVSLPSIFINHVSLTEGDEGITDFIFTISIAQASSKSITVDYATADNTALAGEDYIATNGTLEFASGETEKTIAVQVLGDTEIEEAEIFTFTLSNATNAVIVDSQHKVVLENDDLELIELYRFRNTNYETGGYLFVGEQEKDAILANPDFNETFDLEGVGEDGMVDSAFVASITPGSSLIPFYRLRSLNVSGTHLFVSTEEYNSIFDDYSAQKDQWVKEGLNTEGIDIPEFYLYALDTDQGIEFHRFQDINNHSFLFAGPAETTAIYSDPFLLVNYVDQGIAFESLT